MTRAAPGRLDPRSVATTRASLHHAALLVSAVGRCYAERQPEFRHAALFCADGTLAGWPIERPGAPPLRATLDFESAAVRLGEASVPLDGATFAGFQDAVRGALAASGLDPSRLTLRLPSDLPDGPITSGRRFAVAADESIELGRWFGLADRHLADAAAAHAVPTPVPCWPDHFDLAVVVRMPDAPTADAQVTLGFSPGDGTIAEPYGYVLHWPIAEARVGQAPAPTGGRWQVEGWTGLALPASAILAAPDADDAIASFFSRGFEIARDLVLTA